jgi:hypothetical protein
MSVKSFLFIPLPHQERSLIKTYEESLREGSGASPCKSSGVLVYSPRLDFQGPHGHRLRLLLDMMTAASEGPPLRPSESRFSTDVQAGSFLEVSADPPLTPRDARAESDIVLPSPCPDIPEDLTPIATRHSEAFHQEDLADALAEMLADKEAELEEARRKSETLQERLDQALLQLSFSARLSSSQGNLSPS